MAKKKAKRVAKVVEAKATKAKTKRRQTKGAEYPWEVWSILLPHVQHTVDEAFRTKRQAEAWVKRELSPEYCPVIVHIDIPPMEY